jgi:DNA primase
MLLEELIEHDYELTGKGRWLHSREHDSLVVDTKKQIFYWNSKEIYGDCFSWLTRIKGYSKEKANEILKNNITIENVYKKVIEKEEFTIYPELVNAFYKFGLQNSLEYWFKRGITLKSIERFKLGFTGEYYTIPIFMDGELKNIQIRKENPKVIVNYYKTGKPYLFNSDIMNITNKIIIAEGPTDCIRLSQEGIPCVSHNGGSGCWLEEWFRYFIHQEDIICLYDNDEAGRKGAKKLAQALGIYRTRIYTFTGFADKYDIIDFFNEGYSVNDLLNLVEKESRRSFEL